MWPLRNDFFPAASRGPGLVFLGSPPRVLHFCFVCWAVCASFCFIFNCFLDCYGWCGRVSSFCVSFCVFAPFVARGAALPLVFGTALPLALLALIIFVSLGVALLFFRQPVAWKQYVFNTLNWFPLNTLNFFTGLVGLVVCLAWVVSLIRRALVAQRRVREFVRHQWRLINDKSSIINDILSI